MECSVYWGLYWIMQWLLAWGSDSSCRCGKLSSWVASGIAVLAYWNPSIKNRKKMSDLAPIDSSVVDPFQGSSSYIHHQCQQLHLMLHASATPGHYKGWKYEPNTKPRLAASVWLHSIRGAYHHHESSQSSQIRDNVQCTFSSDQPSIMG